MKGPVAEEMLQRRDRKQSGQRNQQRATKAAAGKEVKKEGPGNTLTEAEVAFLNESKEVKIVCHMQCCGVEWQNFDADPGPDPDTVRLSNLMPIRILL
jgi:hypothetical protein